MSGVAVPEQTDPEPEREPSGSFSFDGIDDPAQWRMPCSPMTFVASHFIDPIACIESLETRTAALEAQHVWLRVEQLEAELARQGKLLEYILGRDYGGGAG